MNVVEINIEELKPYENNPRFNDEAVDLVASSIEDFGFKQPIVIDSDNVIVAGHTRWKAAQKLGLNKIPCILADDLTPKQIKAYRLADNKVAEASTWDNKALQVELEELESLDFDMEPFGFEFFGELQEDSFYEENTLENTPIEKPKSKYGQIYKLGKHRLMVGDSTSKSDVNKLMNNKEANLVVTDPPYNVDYTGATKDSLKIENDSMSDEEFDDFLTKAFEAMNDILELGGEFLCLVCFKQTYQF